MPTPLTLSRVARLCAVLAGDDPERSLSQAIGLLHEWNVVVHRPEGDPRPENDEPWLRIELGGHALSLSAGSQRPDDETRELLRDLLRMALARLAERDEHRHTRERMEMLSAASFEGILIHVDHLVIDANQRLAEMLGYQHSELIGRDVAPLCVAPEDLPAVRDRVANRLEGEYVITGVRKDGTRFRAELNSKQGFLGDRPVRVAAVRDVTERERLAAVLRETETRLRNLAEEAFDAIVLSRGGVVIDVGGSIGALLGLSDEQIVGRPLLDFLAPASVPLAAMMVGQDRVGSYEVTAVHADGQPVPLEVVAASSTLDGKPVRISGLRDLRATRRLESDLRATEEALRKLNSELESRIAERTAQLSAANQELESFSYSVSHNLRTPLRALNGLSAILIEDHAGELRAEARHLLEEIQAASLRMDQLVDGLLSLARLGRVELRRESVDLSAIAHEVLANLARESPRRQIDTFVQPGLRALGDPALLRTVLWNLLSNAWKFSARREVAQIRLSTRDTARGRAIVVSDNGVGFDMAHASKLFRPFHRLHGEREFGGSGIGLATVARVILRHGGEIWAEAEMGQGASFLFTLSE